MARQTTQDITKDIWLCLALLALGGLAIIRVNSGPANTKLALTETLTHATLPTIYAGLLLALTLAVLILSLRSLRRLRAETAAAAQAPAQAPGQPSGRAGWKTRQMRTWGTLTLLVLYVALLPHVHFGLLTSLYLAVMFALYGQRSTVKIGLASVLGGAGMHFLFITLLNLPL